MEYVLYLIGFIMGISALFMALKSILDTRKNAAADFLRRHEKTLRRHNNYPKD